jgi:hypothetical protein
MRQRTGMRSSTAHLDADGAFTLHARGAGPHTVELTTNITRDAKLWRSDSIVVDVRATSELQIFSVDVKQADVDKALR